MGDFDFTDGLPVSADPQAVAFPVRLECINEMLETIGEYPVDDIEADNPDVVQAGQILDRVNRQIQAERWHCNHRREVVLLLPDEQVAVSGGAGTFLFNEIVLETTSNATGVFKYILGGLMYLVNDAGVEFTGNETLTGLTSGATTSGGAHLNFPETRHAIDPNWLRIDTSGLNKNIDVCQVGDFLFNKDQNTFIFDEEITVDYVDRLEFEDLPAALLDYVCAQASRKFQQATRNGQVADGFSSEDVFQKRAKALNEDAENEDELIGGRWVQRILGDRERRQLDVRTR